MSLIPEIGHLYHDFSISNAYTALDAREQLRTRQLNAREDKHLGKYTEVLDKAKDICKRRREWEEDTLRRQLRVLQMKTPSLDRGLRQETERLRRYETSMTSRNNTAGRGMQSRMTSVSEKATLYSHQWPSHTMMSSPQSSLSRRGVESRRTFTRSTDSSSGSNTRSDQNTESQVNFMRRAERVTKELHKLYRRHGERKSSNQHLTDLLKDNNRELLMKARIFFKDDEATAVLESILSGDHSKRKNGVQFRKDNGLYPDNEYTDMLTTVNNDTTTGLDRDSSRDPTLMPLLNDVSDTESGPASSTIANASDNESLINRGRTKWTEIFKTPELWKMYTDRNTSKKKQDAVSSLVTITARYRRTMVR
ncbi:uncharacterized protein LOC132552621 [Ylistrum balloti]|uniref:uncharacterized protein LOC132552621 n=1 Tax=Ylistrum balloti TaxID=509963 RepID=UPI0029058E84|nr:uncharacterized protein LOC132552621 [Ylistrum balloti]